ncbi:hypothetical protein UNDKW_2915 [Undibacterium sp. KW1]|uniref:hypothetical protein n=1 Tax=Undibacterium sp. KW1 TaxID=2058624 RepID=UPI001331E25C|nr:hypothetical protein [Undibacterium sp. KW1]BBB61188.1 hypothetical protein UNDKW_2915 [Undibacterium sp. KW1]
MTPIEPLNRFAADFKARVNNLFMTALSLFITEANALETNVVARHTNIIDRHSDIIIKQGLVDDALANATGQAGIATAAAATAVSAPGTSATSTTANTLALGPMTFSIQTGKSLCKGLWLSICDTASPTDNSMDAQISAYNGTTGQLDVYVYAYKGGGTRNNWSIAVGGAPAVKDFGQNLSTTTGLVYGYFGGIVRNDNLTVSVVGGTLTLSANATNYIECSSAGVVSKNTVAFSSGSYPIAKIVTGATGITSIQDARASALVAPTSVANTVQIGSVIPLSQTANLVTLNGCDYLKTGVLASAGSYPAAPLQNSFSDTTKIIPSGNWGAVAAGGGIAVTIQNGSATGQISYDNGNSWAPITLPSTSYLAITYGAGLFVAVGSSVCATSPDGVNWAPRTIAAQAWQSVIHDGTNFVAVSSGPSTVGTYSVDGFTWSPSTMPSSQNWASLCFGGGLILATPNANVSNVCASSADHGQTWTARTLPQSYNQYAKNCAYGAGLFVVNARDNGGGSTSNTFTSPDCITWTPRNLGVSVSETKTLTFAGGMFLLTRAGTTSCYTSPDGITWTPKTAAVTHSTIATCVANGGRVIGVQGSGAVVDVYTMAYGRGYHIALFADSQNQGLPLYMRMS